MYNFDPCNVFLAIATNKPQRLNLVLCSRVTCLAVAYQCWIYLMQIRILDQWNVKVGRASQCHIKESKWSTKQDQIQILHFITSRFIKSHPIRTRLWCWGFKRGPKRSSLSYDATFRDTDPHDRLLQNHRAAQACTHNISALTRLIISKIKVVYIIYECVMCILIMHIYIWEK